MSATVLTPPININPQAGHPRPGLGRLVAVELRKIINTRSGFWLQIATITAAVVVVIVRCVVGDAADHDFASVLDVGLKPAAILLPITGVLIITSEWSQRTGMITFALVPARARVFYAKLAASLVLTIAMLVASVGIVAAGVLVSSPGTDGTWSDAAPLLGQSTIYLTAGTLTGLAFGAVFLASAPAFVALFVIPIAWSAAVLLPFLTNAAPWSDTRIALDPMTQHVLNTAQWAHAATAEALWMAIPLLIGAWRITRAEVTP
jgi:hypothetical protein